MAAAKRRQFSNLLGHLWAAASKKPVLILLLLLLVVSGCDEEVSQEQEHDVASDSALDIDADEVADTTGDDDPIDSARDEVTDEQSDPAPEPDIDLDAPFDPLEAALILDFDMKPYASWRFTAQTLAELGYQVTYRRWYPHVTLSDIAADPDSGRQPYRLILVASWFYRGLMRGFGTAERPVTVLSYDIATDAVRQELNRQGIHCRVLGGLLGVRFAPADLEEGLFNAGVRADGYWLFQLSDFPMTDDPEVLARLHGAPQDYWTGLTHANERLVEVEPEP